MELLRTLVVGGRLVAAAGVGSAGRGGPWDERCPSGEASGDLSTSPPFRCSPGASQHDGKSTRPVWPRRSRALAGDPVREARQRFPSPTGGQACRPRLPCRRQQRLHSRQRGLRAPRGGGTQAALPLLAERPSRHREALATSRAVHRGLSSAARGSSAKDREPPMITPAMPSSIGSSAGVEDSASAGIHSPADVNVDPPAGTWSRLAWRANGPRRSNS